MVATRIITTMATRTNYSTCSRLFPVTGSLSNRIVFDSDIAEVAKFLSKPIIEACHKSITISNNHNHLSSSATIYSPTQHRPQPRESATHRSISAA